VEYAKEQMDEGEKLWSIVRHMLGLYANMPGGKSPPFITSGGRVL
jgi:hypothetical protein